jgi:hypothetical protein
MYCLEEENKVLCDFKMIFTNGAFVTFFCTFLECCRYMMLIHDSVICWSDPTMEVACVSRVLRVCCLKDCNQISSDFEMVVIGWPYRYFLIVLKMFFFMIIIHHPIYMLDGFDYVLVAHVSHSLNVWLVRGY